MATDDAPGVGALYAELGDDDRYRRFFSHFRPSEEFVAGWVDKCCRLGAGLVALTGEGVLVGEAGYVVQPNGDGEFAVTVAAPWRGWLGPYLLDRLVAVAVRRGVPNLEAEILLENRRMMALVRRRGYVAVGEPDLSVVHVLIGAANGHPSWPPAGVRPRVLVEARSTSWRATRAAEEAGLDVARCPVGAERCPALHGQPCPLAAGADVIVVALPPGDARAGALVRAHADLHAGVPVVVDDTDLAAAPFVATLAELIGTA
jgi:hypothetical protein